MKTRFEFTLNKKVYSLLCRRIKSKNHLIELLIEIASLTIANIQVKDTTYGRFVIDKDNPRRIYFSIQDSVSDVYKHFSINFPFKISEYNGIFTLTTLTGNVLIGSSHIAVLRAICANGGFNEKECQHGLLLDFSQLVESTFEDLNLKMDDYENDLNQILMELFTFEPSYIRYDYDKKNENGRMHPLNHLDIFYTQNTTFKLGCIELQLDNFIDILDCETDCAFIGNE